MHLKRSIWKCAQNVNRHCNWYAEHTSFGESMFSQQRRIYLISIFLQQQQRKSTKKKQSGMMNLSYHDVQHFVSSLLSIVAISHVSAFRISIDTHAFWSLCQEVRERPYLGLLLEGWWMRTLNIWIWCECDVCSVNTLHYRSISAVCMCRKSTKRRFGRLYWLCRCV